MPADGPGFKYRVVEGSRIFATICLRCNETVGWSSRPMYLQIAERAHVCKGATMYTILAVDDYAPHAYALERTLQKAGYKVLTAGNGTDALARAGQSPDLVLLDVGLPDVNGFEVCRRLKANPKTANVPVVFISATHASQDSVAEGERCGASAFLFHPVGKEELLAVIEGSLAKARLHAQEQRRMIGPKAPGTN